MNNSVSIAITKELFEVRLQQLKGKWDISGATLNKVGANQESSLFHSALWLLLAAEQVDNAGDLPNDSLKKAAIQLGERLCQRWREPDASVLTGEKRVWVSNLGAVYGALMNGKRVFAMPKWQKDMIEIRDYVFANGIRGGMLVSHEGAEEPSVDLLAVVMPFGLFSPEDLIVVEAVRFMENYLAKGSKVFSSTMESTHSPVSCAWLGWYYCEKGEVEKAKNYLGLVSDEVVDRFEGESALGKVLSEIISYDLIDEEDDGSLVIQHSPRGNENVYEQLPYERYPREPVEGERVKVRASIWPLKAEDKVFVEKRVKAQWEFLDCRPTDVPNLWEGDLGRAGKEPVEYAFVVFREDEEVRSELFSYAPLRETYIESVLDIHYDDNKISVLVVEATYRKKLNLTVEAVKGGKQLCLFLEETNENRPEEDYPSILYRGGISLTIGEFQLQLNGSNLVIQSTKEENWELESSNLLPFIQLTVNQEQKLHSVQWNFQSPMDERFYGLGERFKQLEYRGEKLDCYVYNQYRDQGHKTYMPVPFFLSSKEYGCYLPTSRYTLFDFASSLGNCWSVKEDLSGATVGSETGTASSLIFFRGSMEEVCRHFIEETAVPEMVPAWALGPWMSSNNWDREAVAREQVRLTEEHQIPATVIVLEQWSDEATYYIFNDAMYEVNDGGTAQSYEDYIFPDWGRWPDPMGMIRDFHGSGLRVILWQIPIQKYLNKQKHSQKEADERYMLAQGYSVKNKDGTAYRMPEGWFKESLLMDFSNPEGRKWWFDKRKYLLDMGVDGFKTDGGEFVFGKEVAFFDGRKGEEMRNEYPNDYVEAYYEFARKAKGEEALTFSRAGYTGAQKFPAHWAGDERSTFEAFRHSLIAGLSAGMSGVIFWGWDLGGFNGDIPSAELFIRSAAMAAFCPIMQYHAESKGEFNQDRTPWNIADRTGDDRALSGYRFFANVRMNLLPYIYDQALKSVRERKPLIRAMVYAFPDELACHGMFDQYMFGDDLLVAPVIEEGATERYVYFPKGKWRNLWKEEAVYGPTYHRVTADLLEIPVYVKDGAILLVNTDSSGKLGSWVGNKMTMEHPLLLIYPSKDGYGDGKTKVITDQTGNETIVTISGEISERFIVVDSPYKQLRVKVYTNKYEYVTWYLNGSVYEKSAGVVLLHESSDDDNSSS